MPKLGLFSGDEIVDLYAYAKYLSTQVFSKTEIVAICKLGVYTPSLHKSIGAIRAIIAQVTD